ncbi:MAG: YggT family protein, partial [Treponema sp.]|nr:YggT family protein [Treponema sp.]
IARITDPYLDWWRRKLNLRVGQLDFSVVAAIAALSMARSIFYSFAQYEKVTLGIILAIVLLSIWSVISFILGFFIVVLVLRLIAYLTNRNIYGTFWQIIDSISQPVLYRLNRIIFGNKIGSFLKGIVLSILMLAAIRIGVGFIIPHITGFLSGLPF